MLTLTSPIETWLHRWPVGVKLGLMALGTALVFPVQSPWVMGAALLALLALYLALGLRFARHGLAMLRPLWPFFLILALWHLWQDEIARGLIIAGRMGFAVALANVVTMTTRLDAMLALVERLLQPLRHIGVNPRMVALAMAMVIRFTPVLLDKMSQLMQAWRARSPKRVGARIVLPVVLLALDDADHVAEALRARGGL